MRSTTVITKPDMRKYLIAKIAKRKRPEKPKLNAHKVKTAKSRSEETIVFNSAGDESF